jgi:2-polyprenyl-3-methyl-5-hydroxy-6-metoxy-1,4-benzoquinol methylase
VQRLKLLQATIWECTAGDCGLQFADPQPDEKELSRAYTDLYYPGDGKMGEARFENTPKPTFHQVFEGLGRRLGNLNGLSLLDYGCGRGALCQVAAEFGLKVSGIESDPEARSIASSIAGASIYSNIDQLRRAEPAKSFDVIVLWTVIEHLRVPWTEIARLRTLLRPGGCLLISTMDIRCLRARIEGARWENYANPTHLFYFDRKSLARAIRAGGFSQCLEWRLRLRYPQHGILRRSFYNVSFVLGLSDGLFYLCRKASEDTDAAGTASALSIPVAQESLNTGGPTRSLQAMEPKL